MSGLPLPIEAEKYLNGVDYPARRDDLVARARDSDAPDEVVSALESMDADEFDSPAAVSRALSDGAS